MSLMGKLLNRGIERYQRSGGGMAWFGIECNFEPSCSEYARQAIAKFGVRKGLPLALRRVGRCNKPDQVDKIMDELPSIGRQTDHA